MWEASRQRDVEMYAGIMTVLHRAWFKGDFQPRQFGGANRAAAIEDIVGRQTPAQKKAGLQSMFRQAAAGIEKRKREAAENGR